MLEKRIAGPATKRMKAIRNTFIVIAMAGVVFGLLALTPIFVMNVGSAWERNAQLGLFRLYSALYYADHPDNVEALACSKGFQEDVSAFGAPPVDPATGRRLSRAALDCIRPTAYRTLVGWCPALFELLSICASVAYPEDVRKLPGFEVGLERYANDPCTLDEARGLELLRLIYAPKSAPAKSMPNSICLSPRMLVVHFVDESARSRHSSIFFPSKPASRRIAGFWFPGVLGQIPAESGRTSWP